ncbi:hypothetical protein [Arthrobacter sp. D5-1]|uniref:hypothetical protein n=1 Tax=Arthrobacter sp. D5-1 TaxID=1477518 RepID=UPI001A986B94|nr:hypothetical protein [Arthrobacter sp. D5-1]QSZ49573.1 hypothetical protein AYX22_14970 [Arthrobacter sp. D5-1]
MAGWRYFSVSTGTWGGKIELPAFNFTGGRRLNGGTGGTATFKVGDPSVAEVVTAASITPLERILVAEWDGNAVYAGFITSVAEDQDEQTVTVTHQDIWWLWQRRHVLSVRGDGAQSAPAMTYSNRTLATLANLVVARGMNGTPAARYALPLIMNADVAGPHSRTYYGYKFESVADALQELMDTDGGPDIDFDVQWDSGTGSFRWVMRSGSLTSGEWEWDATATHMEVHGLKLDTTAEDVTNRVIGRGEGSGEDILVRAADSFTGTAPALESVPSFSGTSNAAQLQSRVTGALNAANEPVQQISFKIPAGGDVKIGQFILGGNAHLKTSGLRFLSAGWHDWRLIQFDFDRDWITLQFQQIGG